MEHEGYKKEKKEKKEGFLQDSVDTLREALKRKN